MSTSEGEVKKIDEIISEETKKLEEQVNNKLETIIENRGIDYRLVEPVIELVTSNAATVISEGAKLVTEKIGLKMISESNLSENQKKLATSIYNDIKKATEKFINDQNLNNTIKITMTIGQVIKGLESSKIEGIIVTGADKKAIAIQLGRILIKEVTPDDKGESEIIMMYDLIAEQTLEAMIEVSKVVNVAVQEMATKCCPGLLEFFKRKKTT